MATALDTAAQTDEPPVVFVSYSKHDKVWKDRLLGHLGVLEKAGLISAWSDDEIDKGGEWLPPLVQAMKEASVAVCLISHNYLNTDFCVKHEIPYLIERAEEEGLHLLFFMVSPADYAAHRWLADRQWFLPKGQCVETDFAGRENLPFSWLVKDIRERLGERVQAQEKPSVSDYIRQAVAALEADAASKPEPEPMPAVEIIESAFAPLPEACIDIERLPMTGKELFGRQDELQMLDDAWASDSTNIVALTAWGGVGKSTLVNKWTERLAKDNYRGASRVFVWSFYSQGTRDQTTSADAFIDEALRFFGEGEPAPGSPWARGERLAELVGKQKALLLLDGMEPLQDPYQGIKDPALARLIACLAVKNAGLCVITTREKVKELEDFPDHVIEQDLEQISSEAGRALLRVKRVRGSDAALEQASRDFGNHALAINLLASFLQGYDSRHISQAASIPELPDLEDHHHRHPRRVMAAFAEHFGDSPALDILHMIGLFDRPADARCIASLRNEPVVPGLTDKLAALDEIGWQDVLTHLRSLGLLAGVSKHAPDELDAHPLVREHFGAGLRDERPDAWKAGHERLYEHLKSVPKTLQPELLSELEYLFRAVFHGCTADKHFEVLFSVYLFRIRRDDQNHHHKKIGAFASDLAALTGFFEKPWSKCNTSIDVSAHRVILSQAGLCLRALGRLLDAEIPFAKAVDLAIEAEDIAQSARGKNNICELSLQLGNVEKAISLGQESVALADEGTDRFIQLVARTSLGDALHQFGQIEEASTYFDSAESLQAISRPNIKWLYSVRSYHYCDLLLTQGKEKEALERGRYSAELERSRGNHLDIGLGKLIVGRAAMVLADWHEARPQLDQAIDRLRAAGTMDHLPRGLITRAAFFREVEEYALSWRDLDEAMSLAKRCGMLLSKCDAHLEYTRLEIKQGQPDAARVHVKAADELVNACGYHRRDGELLELKGELGL